MPSMTITTTGAQASRLAVAIGFALRLTDPQTGAPRDATPSEMKNYVIQFLRETVQGHEQRVAVQAVVNQPQADFDPT